LGEDAWTRVKRRLRAELGDDVFMSWLARLEMEEVTDSCARLSVPTRFLKSWIEAHYLERVQTAYRSEASSVANIAIVVRSGSREGVAAKASEVARRNAAAAAKPNGVHVNGSALDGAIATIASPASTSLRSDGGDIAGAPLDPRLTFESFVVGRSNALAQAAAERIARHDGPTALYNPLYIQAGVGLGKTHLMHAVGNQSRVAGRRVIYLTADRLCTGSWPP
jgi:chromosomal replication initiator protein